jgi:hypothetical protein
MLQLTNESKARRLLIGMTDALCAPVLGDDEIDDLLADNAIASTWTAETEYEFGAEVIPTANKRNGRKYKAVAFDGAGRESGTTEPEWTTSREAQFTDGNITWEESGSEPNSLWNLNKAAEQGWTRKAGKVAADHDYGTADLKMSAGQMYGHCIEQANRFHQGEIA